MSSYPATAEPAKPLIAWLKLLRVHQWSKNGLIFLPLLTAHELHHLDHLVPAILAFVAFSLSASALYIVNDVRDRDDDREHPTKRLRPLAAGTIALRPALAVAALLLCIAVAIGLQLSPRFLIIMLAYATLSGLYTLALKRVAVLDVIFLACLYAVRTVAGAQAAELVLSFWLSLFALLGFLSLALLKRYSELANLKRHGQFSLRGRDYHVDDLPILGAFGVAAGLGSVLVIAMYSKSESTIGLYNHPNRLGLLVVLGLFWIMRAWLLAHRGRMHDDPVLWAIKDVTSFFVAIGCALSIYFAI